ncbi:DUF6458 family protein [Naumannella halotolerans]|uniref:DUF6458 domain-containing protein n=1 Tax=Naumannella halotolerans TaxID=993414 RepID=A0A4R7J800_9ACTN|nr:DUF6458 family protein [Naumannella halotolerans]TDT32637.1 hypothetical protein CLV29_0219 [Naumannella halotolerans]
MSIGFGIFLMVVGAILAFALEIQVSWIDLRLVGYLLIAAGALVTVLGLVLIFRRRSSSTVSSTSIDPKSGARITRQESSRPETKY